MAAGKDNADRAPGNGSEPFEQSRYSLSIAEHTDGGASRLVPGAIVPMAKLVFSEKVELSVKSSKPLSKVHFERLYPNSLLNRHNRQRLDTKLPKLPVLPPREVQAVMPLGANRTVGDSSALCVRATSNEWLDSGRDLSSCSG